VNWDIFYNPTSGWHWRCVSDDEALVAHSTSFVDRVECEADARRHGSPDVYAVAESPHLLAALRRERHWRERLREAKQSTDPEAADIAERFLTEYKELLLTMEGPGCAWRARRTAR
jgi:hypothetical protein